MSQTVRAAMKFLVRSKRTATTDTEGVNRRLVEFAQLRLGDLPARARLRVEHMRNLLRERSTRVVS